MASGINLLTPVPFGMGLDGVLVGDIWLRLGRKLRLMYGQSPSALTSTASDVWGVVANGPLALHRTGCIFSGSLSVHGIMSRGSWPGKGGKGR